MFQGSIVALVTPMTLAGVLDEPKLRALIEWHLSEGTQGFVINGTTGEAPTLTEEERLKTLKIAKEMVKNRVPIIAGTGTSGTAETLRRTKTAKELGVDACLVITPYCNKPTQEGLYQHYKTIAEAVSIPLILYNVAARTACDLLPETVQRLSKISNIIGLKEGGGDLSRGRALKAACGEDFALYSGDDSSSLMFMLQGGKGVISVTANVAPKAMREMCDAALSRQTDVAGERNARLMPLHKGLFLEANPIPVKWVLQKLGRIEGGIRLPLTPLSEQYHETLREAMKFAGVR